MISVLIADKNYLSRLGLFTLLSASPNFEVDYTEDENFENLMACIKKSKPKILVLDFQSLNINSKQIATITKTFKRLQVLSDSNHYHRNKKGRGKSGRKYFKSKGCSRRDHKT